MDQVSGDADQAKRKKRQAEDILLTLHESGGRSQSSEVEVVWLRRGQGGMTDRRPV